VKIIKKYPKIHRLGKDENKDFFKYQDDYVVITEKLDGANARMWVEDDEIIFGSRNVNNINNSDQWGEYIDYVKEIVDPDDLDDDFIYIGEFMKPHTISYGDVPKVIFFDILYKENGHPISYDIAMKEFEDLNLDYIDPYFEGKLKDLNKEDLEKFMKKSQYRDGQPEGIVLKNYDRMNRFGRPLYAKMVNDKFKEKHKANFKNDGGKKRDKVYNEMRYLVDKYATEQRIKKQIYNLRDEKGMDISRKMMNYLIPMVIEDILQEEIVEIYRSSKINCIDFKVLQQHQMIPSLCLKTIDEMMDEKVEN